MPIEKVSISLLSENPENPRIIKDDKFKKLVKSIKEAPWMLDIRPLVVNDNFIVLGGNMRLKACKEAKITEVPVIKTSDLTEEQQKEFIIKDNLAYGEWDWDELASTWDIETLNDWGLDISIPKSGEQEELERGEDFQRKFEVVVDCIDEKEQERVFNLLEEKGYKCRVLSM